MGFNSAFKGLNNWFYNSDDVCLLRGTSGVFKDHSVFKALGGSFLNYTIFSIRNVQKRQPLSITETSADREPKRPANTDALPQFHFCLGML